LEDSDANAPCPPKRTLAQAVEYAKEQGYKIVVWGKWLTIEQAEALLAEGKAQ
jgi:hypothetical protein